MQQKQERAQQENQKVNVQISKTKRANQVVAFQNWTGHVLIENEDAAVVISGSEDKTLMQDG